MPSTDHWHVAPRCTQIAAALQAEKLILMTDVPGVLRDKDDVSTKYASLEIRGVRELVREGIIAGGMIPKVGWPGPGRGAGQQMLAR
jgi:acetylglutamate kinase